MQLFQSMLSLTRLLAYIQALSKEINEVDGRLELNLARSVLGCPLIKRAYFRIRQ